MFLLFFVRRGLSRRLQPDAASSPHSGTSDGSPFRRPDDLSEGLVEVQVQSLPESQTRSPDRETW